MVLGGRDMRTVAEVRLWGRAIGAVALEDGAETAAFEYDPAFVRSGIEIAPLAMPLARKVYSFPALGREAFHGLPGLLADSLPDRFGNALINAWLATQGRRPDSFNAVERLCYTGTRGMGALEYFPALGPARVRRSTHLEIDKLVELASEVLTRRHALQSSFGDDGSKAEALRDILRVGTSAGGARAKAVIGWHPGTNQVVSGQFEVPEGFEHWLLKFDVGGDGQLGTTAGFGRIEYAHYLMAREAGVEMSDCRLLEEGGRAHFMTRRFDRVGNEKLHMQSLCALQHLDFNMPYVHGYEQYLRTILALKLGAVALEQAWMRCAFNVAAVNCDDHTKNFAFLMDRTGTWKLAPAYDNCFSHNPAEGRWTRMHQMQVAGKKWNITATDLIDLAKAYDIPAPAERLQRICQAVAQWPTYAREAGVPAVEIERISQFQPAWTRSFA